ncbi:hypothetical protein HK099_004103 [Clydaea vesicula]|uniref:Uncharacterized protein n=1 Tax=Clydaea vesicula TaxID=447962 RepID=A0AAD5U0N7_9FUNG|nr:hypothetical protein HK099_004103 [Clydaea vesicula]
MFKFNIFLLLNLLFSSALTQAVEQPAQNGLSREIIIVIIVLAIVLFFVTFFAFLVFLKKKRNANEPKGVEKEPKSVLSKKDSIREHRRELDEWKDELHNVTLNRNKSLQKSKAATGSVANV